MAKRCQVLLTTEKLSRMHLYLCGLPVQRQNYCLLWHVANNIGCEIGRRWISPNSTIFQPSVGMVLQFLWKQRQDTGTGGRSACLCGWPFISTLPGCAPVRSCSRLFFSTWPGHLSRDLQVTLHKFQLIVDNNWCFLMLTWKWLCIGVPSVDALLITHEHYRKSLIN